MEARQDKPKLPKPISTIQGYGLAVLSVFVALGGALLLEDFHFRDVEVPLFLFAAALAAWYGGTGAAVLALLLSCVSFDYFFVEPLHTLDISRSHLPYFIVFASFALLVSWFSTVRRRVEGELRQARDDLEIEVAERTQQASLLNLTHDTIFVRDMSDVITYWNRGAQELYGWTAEEAIGKRAHELLQSVLPAPARAEPILFLTNRKGVTDFGCQWRHSNDCARHESGGPPRSRYATASRAGVSRRNFGIW